MTVSQEAQNFAWLLARRDFYGKTLLNQQGAPLRDQVEALTALREDLAGRILHREDTRALREMLYLDLALERFDESWSLTIYGLLFVVGQALSAIALCTLVMSRLSAARQALKKVLAPIIGDHHE